MKGLISTIPEVTSYLADKRIMAAAGAIFGKYFRVSTVGGLVNWPGTERGYWHSDWPYNQTVESHIPAPYPDTMMHLSSLWMLTSFSAENGGTLIVPGSHRSPNNPSGENGVDRNAPHPEEINITGRLGLLRNGDRPRRHLLFKPEHHTGGRYETCRIRMRQNRPNPAVQPSGRRGVRIDGADPCLFSLRSETIRRPATTEFIPPARPPSS